MLFDIYVVVDPGLWQDDAELARQALTPARPTTGPRPSVLKIADESDKMRAALGLRVSVQTASKPADLDWTYQPRAEQGHASYHRAALDALCALLPVRAP